LRESELDLVIVTGRPPRWISPIVEMTGHRGVGIAANGAVVLDLADGRITNPQVDHELLNNFSSIFMVTHDE